MDLKKKAGLALALAAIFTTGGATVALADNTSIGNNGIIGTDQGADEPLAVSTDNVNPTIKTRVGGDAVSEIRVVNNDTESLTIDAGASDLTINGGGGNLVHTDNGDLVETVIVTGNLIFGADSVGGTLKNLEVSGTTTVEEGNTITIAGTLDVGGDITVGDSSDTTSATLNVDNLMLNGNGIFVDPALGDNYGPSQVAAKTFIDPAYSTSNSYINGLLVAGVNSTITIGSGTHDLVDKAIADTGMWEPFVSAGDQYYSAAMAFIGPQALLSGAGGLYVGDDATAVSDATAGDITFADNSLAVFDLTGVDDVTAALSANDGSDPVGNTTTALGTVTIGKIAAGDGDDNAAGVYFHNAKDGSYLIIGNATLTITGAAMTDAGINAATQHHWNNGNMHFSSGLFDGEWRLANTGKDLILDVTYNSANLAKVYPDLSSGMAGLVNEIYSTSQNDVFYNRTTGENTYNDGNEAGIAFVSRLTDFDFINAKEGARGLESAAQIAVAAGVPALTNNVISKVGGLIVDHNNLLNDTQPAYGNEPGAFGLWLNPFYGFSDVDGLDSGSFEHGYEINYGGAAFGLDYNLNEAFRLGLALNAGGGDSESQGDFNKAENDFDFFGVSLYGSYSNGAFGLTGDLGYTTVDNDTELNAPAIRMGSKIKSSMDSDAFTIGLTGQYRFSAGENLNVTPHLGLRYTKVSTDDADLKLGGLTFFKVETEDQNLFQIPLGVEFSSDIVTDGGWTVTPSADLGVLFTMGDTDVDSLARVPGVAGKWRTNSDVMDSAAFMGALGIKAKADNGLSLGLDYGILASGNQTDHQFSGMLRFEF